MSELPTNHPSPNIAPYISNEPQPQSKTVLRKPWLHLVVFSIVNAIAVLAILSIFNTILSFSLVSIVLIGGMPVVPIFGISFPLIHVLLITFETILAVFCFFFIYRKYSVAIPKIIIVIVIGVLAYGGIILPQYIARTQEDVANPIQVGEKHFNFLDDTIINSRESAKNTLAISDHAVIWVEHTKQFPPHDYNAWELFLFTFDKDSGRSETVQLTDAENNISKSPDSAIIDGDSIYWTIDAKLYKYDIPTGEKEVIREKTSGIYGVNGGIALVSDLDEGEYGGVSIYGAPNKGLYLVDLSTKTTIQDLSKYERGSDVNGVVGSDVYCPYDYDTGVVSIVPLVSDPVVLDIDLPYSAEYSNDIVTCNSDSVVFTSQDGLRIYDTKTAKTTTIDASIISARAKLLNETLYFIDEAGYKLQKYILTTGEIVDIAALPQDNWSSHQKYWDINQGYMVYLERTFEYESSVHLRSLHTK
jgi:hypothetical protein